MSSETGNLPSGIGSKSPAREPQANPRDLPMHCRPGYTIGQHLDEFANSNFDQDVYSILHGKPRSPELAPLQSKSDADKATAPQEKMKMDDYMNKLKYGDIEEARKCLVQSSGEDQEQKREDAAAQTSK